MVISSISYFVYSFVIGCTVALRRPGSVCADMERYEIDEKRGCLVRLLRCSGALFSVGDECIESWVAMERFEIGVSFDR